MPRHMDVTNGGSTEASHASDGSSCPENNSISVSLMSPCTREGNRCGDALAGILGRFPLRKLYLQCIH